ncbi:hypothetical protein BDQ94DRAFT_149107 [Aspergillus welwitschiae]|uniref:Uncharacterized protein n=1 Tax=Aspergillus welwitschiae TaxID=1341132 RepID=A0A3F3PTL6_9EURO|nr:hypothetical protein BDQ94DRAFT_149107 [Aspergillus welwitschiae]RDH30168.1 hypothetical protein BDQ94DRAFT_149107 [Aspergillus welwitschiae]
MPRHYRPLLIALPSAVISFPIIVVQTPSPTHSPEQRSHFQSFAILTGKISR